MSRGREFLEPFLMLGHKRRDLLVMDSSNDPFDCGASAQVRDAEFRRHQCREVRQ